MFSLKHALAHWRRNLIDAGVDDRAAVEELESHLRDEIEAQVRSGLPEMEAFEKAVQRIGPVETLGQEFVGVERNIKNVLPLAVVGIYSIIGGGSAIFKLGSFSDVSQMQQMSAVSAVVIAAVLILNGRRFSRILPALSDQRARIAVYGIGVLAVLALLIAFYHHVMTRAEWDMSHLVVALLWAWIPMAALCGVILGMEEAATAQKPITHV